MSGLASSFLFGRAGEFLAFFFDSLELFGSFCFKAKRITMKTHAV